MKKSLLVLTFLIGISFSAPDANLMLMRHRHTIEYSIENHTKYLTENEIIKERVAMYLKLSIILSAAARFQENKEKNFNTS